MPSRKRFDFRPSEIVSGAVLGLDDLLPNLVIVFDKRSQNLKVWLSFAPQRLQSSCEAAKQL